LYDASLLRPVNHHDVRVLLDPLEDDRLPVGRDVEISNDDVAAEVGQLPPATGGEVRGPQVLVLDVSA
jgi:hypothetical protein